MQESLKKGSRDHVDEENPTGSVSAQPHLHQREIQAYGTVNHALPLDLEEPVRLEITAGAMTGTGGLPQPLGASVLDTVCTSTATGASFMYAGVKSGNCVGQS